MAKSFTDIVSQMTKSIKGVREAVLGKEVREHIASGMESELDIYKQLNTAVEETKTAIAEAIDPTLTLSGKAADAKATGAAVDKEKERASEKERALENKKADKTDLHVERKRIDTLNEGLDVERKRIDTLNEGGLNLKDEVIDTSIKEWLTEHPEATTTVQDGSIDIEKLSIGLREKIVQNYATVEAMIADEKIKEEAVVMTLGYYAQNDGGGAKYLICKSKPTTHYETLKNSLYAKLIFFEGNIVVDQYGAHKDGNADDSIAIQEAINDAGFLNSLQNSNSITNSVVFSHGEYTIKNTIYFSPIIKFISNGLTIFRSKVENGATFKMGIYSDNGVIYEHKNIYDVRMQKTFGDFALIYDNTLEKANSIGIQLNGEDDESHGFRSAWVGWTAFQNWNIENFGVGIDCYPYELFLIQFDSVMIQNCKIGIQFHNFAAAHDSGEAIKFNNIIIAGADYGMYIDTPGMWIVITNSSFDFNKECIYVNKGNTILKISNIHSEANSKSFIAVSEKLHDKGSCKAFVYGLESMGISDYYFKGNMLLTMLGCTLIGSESQRAVPALCDDNVAVINTDYITDRYSSLPLQLQLNTILDPNLRTYDNGTVKDGTILNEFCAFFGTEGKLSIVDAGYLQGGKSFRYTGPGNLYFESIPYDVIPGSIIMNGMHYKYKNALRCSIFTVFYDSERKIIPLAIGEGILSPTDVTAEDLNYSYNGNTSQDTLLDKWRRIPLMESVVVPPNAIYAITRYYINPVFDGEELLISNFYRGFTHVGKNKSDYLSPNKNDYLSYKDITGSNNYEKVSTIAENRYVLLQVQSISTEPHGGTLKIGECEFNLYFQAQYCIETISLPIKAGTSIWYKADSNKKDNVRIKSLD